MKDESENVGGVADAVGTPGLPATADRATWQADIDALRTREKSHTREGMRSRRPGVGFRWSRWTPPFR